MIEREREKKKAKRRNKLTILDDTKATNQNETKDYDRSRIGECETIETVVYKMNGEQGVEANHNEWSRAIGTHTHTHFEIEPMS